MRPVLYRGVSEVMETWLALTTPVLGVTRASALPPAKAMSQKTNTSALLASIAPGNVCPLPHFRRLLLTVIMQTYGTGHHDLFSQGSRELADRRKRIRQRQV